jgi:hypothetical protein
MVKRIGGVVMVLALLALGAVSAACSAASPTPRPFEGSADGYASYGYGEGSGTDGLSNVLGCNVDLPVDEFYKVTTFTSADGTADDLGAVHLEFDHCPGNTGMDQGQIAFVTDNGDVLYGEYQGTYEADGAHASIEFKANSSTGTCYLLNDVACASTGRFANATGEATVIADAYPGDPSDPFVPWPWHGTWTGTLSY